MTKNWEKYLRTALEKASLSLCCGSLELVEYCAADVKNGNGNLEKLVEDYEDKLDSARTEVLLRKLCLTELKRQLMKGRKKKEKLESSIASCRV